MICVYRYSDKGKNPIDYGYPFSKRDCFESFLKAFPSSKKVIIADNCEDVSLFDGHEVIQTNLGKSASAEFAFEFSIKNFDEKEVIYFAEDDYLYKDNCEKLLEEALCLVDYATLYDHGDKYKSFNKQPNPLLVWEGEKTILFRTESSHWKITNSTTMTFAVRNSTLKQDLEIIKKFLKTQIPQDFQMFLELNRRNRTLASSVPCFSTHLSPDKDNVSPFFYV